DKIDERDSQMAPVEIDIAVEEVRFQARHQTTHRRAQPEIGDAVDRAAGERVVGAVATDAHGIDAEGRVQIIVETEVCRRKPNRAPAPVANSYAPVDFPEAAKQGRRITRLSGLQQLADTGRGIDSRVIPANRFEHGDAKAVLLAGGAQHIRGPAPAVA